MFETVITRNGMLFILLGLCAAVSVITYAEQHPNDAAGARRFASTIATHHGLNAKVLIVVRDVPDDALFAETLRVSLAERQIKVVDVVKGEPRDARAALVRASADEGSIDVIACNQTSARWLVFQDLAQSFPNLSSVTIAVPTTYKWPNFLKRDNLLNVCNRISINAIVAIGMTIVIITGGIDLSVGSLMALSAVVTSLVIRDLCGARDASWVGLGFSCLIGVATCTAVGLFTGLTITLFRVPPFIVTLAMMQVTSGLAYRWTNGESVYQIPESFVQFASGTVWGNIPNSVVLMISLYVLAHILMSQTVWGRYIYAVGGNAEAARLTGVPVQRVLVFVYLLTGLLAGLGGVVLASQLKSGSPNFGKMAELEIIAAVVVGGTSLSGGEGRMFGTLIGALVVAVVQNGMNLTNVSSYSQQVVLGSVILLAVLLDQLKHHSWLRRRLKSKEELA